MSLFTLRRASTSLAARALGARGGHRGVTLVSGRSLLSSDAVPPKVDSAASSIKMPRGLHEYPHEALLILAAQGNHDAIEEHMTREIIDVDSVGRAEAVVRRSEIEREAQKGLWFYKLPYRVGITAALIAGFGSIPMCFDLNTALWFNEGYVTSEVPPCDDLETWLEVGSWSWGWMEPPLGQMSFFLLTLQYTRSQMRNIGMNPYTEMLHQRRARALCGKFPEYAPIVISMYSDMAFTNLKHGS